MRLDRVVMALTMACCTFDSSGLDVTSAAGGTGSGGVTTGGTGEVTTGTAGATSTGDTPTGDGPSGESTVGLTTTPSPDTGDTGLTGETTGEPTGSSSGAPQGVCGDGQLDAGEVCDDGNTDDTDACVQCQSAVCGDGFVQASVEVCDDANMDETDQCTSLCNVPACDDQARNGDESDIDCGGSCPDCQTGRLCGVDDDCVGNCGGGVCVDFRSCFELKMNQPEAPSGVYTIDPDQAGGGPPFSVYCAQQQDGGGWTMVLKVDGSKGTFVYAAPLWTDANTFNVDSALNHVETKLQSFSTVPMTEMLVGIEAPIEQGDQLKLKFVKLAAPATSAQALFMGDKYLASNLGRDAWKAWIADSSLQQHCNREGLNVTAPASPGSYARVRIGIIANENAPDDCTTPNSYIGVGGGGTGVCVPTAKTTTGNRAGCEADKGDRDIPGFAVVFVR